MFYPYTKHAASTVWHEGVQYTAYFGGTLEGHPDQCLYICKNADLKSSVKLKIKSKYIPWNPVLFSLDGFLFIIFKTGVFCDRWLTWIAKVKPDLTLYDETIIPAGLNMSVKNPPLVLDNDIYFGASVETQENWTSYIEKWSYIKGSFKYIERSNPLTLKTGGGLIQPALWLEHNTIHALFRSKGFENLAYSYMKSGGEWTIPIITHIPNPNSSVCVINLKNNVYLTYNNSSVNRQPLLIRQITTEKQNNSYTLTLGNYYKVIEMGSQKEYRELYLDIKKKDEFHVFATNEASYPYMAPSPDGNISLVYTRARRDIIHRTIKVD